MDLAGGDRDAREVSVPAPGSVVIITASEGVGGVERR